MGLIKGSILRVIFPPFFPIKGDGLPKPSKTFTVAETADR